MFDFHEGFGYATITPGIADGATNQPLDRRVACTISFEPSHLPSWTRVPYTDLRFGTTNPPDIVLRGFQGVRLWGSGDVVWPLRYDPGPLTAGQTYYWQVSVSSVWNGFVSSPVWSFSTTSPE
jgi:hypothetical protein